MAGYQGGMSSLKGGQLTEDERAASEQVGRMFLPPPDPTLDSAGQAGPANLRFEMAQFEGELNDDLIKDGLAMQRGMHVATTMRRQDQEARKMDAQEQQFMEYTDHLQSEFEMNPDVDQAEVSRNYLRANPGALANSMIKDAHSFTTAKVGSKVDDEIAKNRRGLEVLTGKFDLKNKRFEYDNIGEIHAEKLEIMALAKDEREARRIEMDYNRLISDSKTDALEKHKDKFDALQEVMASGGTEVDARKAAAVGSRWAASAGVAYNPKMMVHLAALGDNLKYINKELMDDEKWEELTGAIGELNSDDPKVVDEAMTKIWTTTGQAMDSHESNKADLELQTLQAGLEGKKLTNVERQAKTHWKDSVSPVEDRLVVIDKASEELTKISDNYVDEVFGDIPVGGDLKGPVATGISEIASTVRRSIGVMGGSDVGLPVKIKNDLAWINEHIAAVNSEPGSPLYKKHIAESGNGDLKAVFNKVRDKARELIDDAAVYQQGEVDRVRAENRSIGQGVPFDPKREPPERKDPNKKPALPGAG